MEVVDNNADHNEVLDAAITYKIDGTYPSNSLKDTEEKGNSKESRAALNR